MTLTTQTFCECKLFLGVRIDGAVQKVMEKMTQNVLAYVCPHGQLHKTNIYAEVTDKNMFSVCKAKHPRLTEMLK